MFCTECGQEMADTAKFCAYCGTRRVASPAPREAAPPPPPPPARPDIAPVAPPPAPAVRPVRSTAEIMPMPVRPVATQPVRDERPTVEIEPLPPIEPEAPWPERESAAPPMPTMPEPPVVARQRVTRPAPPPPEPVAAGGYASVPFAAQPGTADFHGERRKISPVLIGAILVALIALGGIFWMVRSTLSANSKVAAGPVTITIYPTSTKVAPGKSVDFVAEVSGAPSSDVTWAVEENEGTVTSRGASAKGDSISLYCTYTASTKPGTYHLVATSTADKLKSATADITVAAASGK